MPIITMILAFFSSKLGRYVGWGMVAAAVYLAGDIHGYNAEHERCEARAKAAQEAANRQDAQAQKDVTQNDTETVATLKKQKDEADGIIEQLQKQIQQAQVDCVYGPNEQPANGVHDDGGKGASDTSNPGPTRVPTTRVGPSGEPR